MNMILQKWLFLAKIYSLCDKIEVTIFLLRLFPSPIIGSHHRGWRQTWQKIRWRVMCLPVVLEVSWLWSTKMESFLMLSLHSPLARAETLVPLVTVISQSDGKENRGRKSFPLRIFVVDVINWGTAITRARGNILGKVRRWQSFPQSRGIKGINENMHYISLALLLSVVSLFNSPHRHNTSLISAHSILRFLCFLTVLCSRWQALTSSHH